MTDDTPANDHARGLIETLASGLTRETLHNGEILVYTVTNPARETIDAWINVMADTVENSPKDRRYLTLYDVGYDKMAFTPYIRQRFEEFTRRFPHTIGYTAIRVRRTSVARIARLFIEHEMQRRHKTQTFKIFFEYDEALAWLEEQLPNGE